MFLSEEEDTYNKLLEDTAKLLNLPLEDVTVIMRVYFRECQKHLKKNLPFNIWGFLTFKHNLRSRKYHARIAARKKKSSKKAARRFHMKKGRTWARTKERNNDRKRRKKIEAIARARGIGKQCCSRYLIPPAEAKKIWDEIKGPKYFFTKGHKLYLIREEKKAKRLARKKQA